MPNFRRVVYLVFFLVGDIRRLNFPFRRFGTLCHLHYRPMEMEQCSEALAQNIQNPGNRPQERIRYV
jgi:hypothetical protein